MRREGGRGDHRVGWDWTTGWHEARHLHGDHAACCLHDGNGLVVVDVDAGDAVDRDHLVVDPETCLVSWAPASHS